jgi:hypothetical protein
LTITVKSEDISDKVESVNSLYPASCLEGDGNYREEGVCHSDLMSVLDRFFGSQDLFFEAINECGEVKKKGLLPDEKGDGPADYLERVIEYNTEPSYNVVFGETGEGLALHARTLSTYRTNLGPRMGQPETYYIGLVNIPSAEDYGDVGTDDLVDATPEHVGALLEGGDSTPSIQDVARHALNGAERAIQLFKR